MVCRRGYAPALVRVPAASAGLVLTVGPAVVFDYISYTILIIRLNCPTCPNARAWGTFRTFSQVGRLCPSAPLRVRYSYQSYIAAQPDERRMRSHQQQYLCKIDYADSDDDELLVMAMSDMMTGDDDGGGHGGMIMMMTIMAMAVVMVAAVTMMVVRDDDDRVSKARHA